MVDDTIALLIVLAVVCGLCAFGAWWSDRWTRNHQPRRPDWWRDGEPHHSTQVGQSHKPWM